MHAPRLSTAVADAIPQPAPPLPAAAPEPATNLPTDPKGETAEPERVAPASPGGIEAAPARRRRGPLMSLLRRPAEYLRAYLTASLHHRLQLQAEHQTQLQAELQAEWAEREGRDGRLAETVARLYEALAHAAARADMAAARADLTAAEDSDRTARLTADVAALALRLDAAEPPAREAARRGEAYALDQLALARRGVDAADHAVARLDQILGVLGPRLDELEIKVRPLIEIDAESAAVRTADGYVMLPRSEPLFITAVAGAPSGGLEPGTRRVLRALLRPGDACADVGANVGLLTVAMAFAVGPAGRVWAFEPEARVRAQLARTLHLNGLAQVALSGEAVGARSGRLTFHQSPIIGHSSLYALPDDEAAAERAVEVEVVALDAVVPPGVALAAVKIDVEGAELDVLAGMGRVAADSPDLAVVAEFGPSHLRRTGVSPEAWFAAFAALGLAPRRIAEPGGAVSPVGAADLAEVVSVNVVFVRPGGAADGRLPR